MDSWRGSTVSQRLQQDEASRDMRPVVAPEIVPVQPAPAPALAPEPSRLSLLKKPLGGGADPYAALRAPLSNLPRR